MSTDLARPSATVRADRRATLIGAAICTAAVAAVTLIGSGTVSYWLDEAASLSAAQRSLPQLWVLAGNIDAVHTAYYALLHGWIAVFGNGQVATRSLSALAVGVAAAGVWTFMRSGGRFTGRAHLVVPVATVVVFAALPRVSWAGVEARPFALSAALAIWSTVLVDRGVRQELRGGRSWPIWTGYAVLAGVAVVVHLYVVLLVVGHLLTGWLSRGVPRSTRLRLTLAAAAAMLIGLPVILVGRAQAAQLGQQHQGAGQLLRNIVVNQWFLGATPTSVTGANVAPATGLAAAWPVTAVALSVLGWLAIGLATLSIRRPGASAADPDERRAPGPVAWSVPALVVPSLLIGVYSLLVSPVYNPRYFTFAAPAVAVLITTGLSTVRWRAALPVGVAMVILLALPVWLSQRQVNGKSGSDWSQVAGYVADHRQAGDSVYFSPIEPAHGKVVSRTVRDIAVAYPAPFAGLADLTLIEDGRATGSLTGTSRLLSDATGALATADRVWVIESVAEDPAQVAVDDAVLTRAGLCPAAGWSGPLDSAVPWSRC